MRGGNIAYQKGRKRTAKAKIRIDTEKKGQNARCLRV